jgi:uncharacterized protein (DUF934 family)
MQIIKDNQITDNAWHYVADDNTISSGNVIVSSARLRENQAQLTSHQGLLGVRLLPGDSVESIQAYLPHLALVELYFPDMNDGRLFTFAWLLRNRLNFQGEIRASGHYVPEQVFYLSRVGVNAFAPDNSKALSVTLTNLKDFSVKYQPSVN